MSTQNLFRPGKLKWGPDADAQGAPDGILLRATNTVSDAEGGRSLRAGSDLLYSDLEGSTGQVHSLYTAELRDGSTYRIAGVDDTIYVNGAVQAVDVSGSGDLAIADDSTQIFIARGTTKKKWDGAALHNWSIPKPTAAPTLTAVSRVTATIADFNNSESPAVTVTEGTGTVGGTTDQAGTANEATYVTPSAKHRASLTRLFTTDQNFFDISNVTGSETDLIEVYVKFDDPRNVEGIKIEFGLDSSSTIPFRDNRFAFDFLIKDGLNIPVKDKESEGYAAYETAILSAVEGVGPWEISGIQSPSQVKQTLGQVGKTPSPKTQLPPAGTWGRLTVSRGQFERVGNDAARGWNTVRGFRLTYFSLKGKTDGVTVSDAIVVGGGKRTLTGTFRCVIQGVRSVKDPTGQIIYYEKSPPSKQSQPVNLNHQTLQITVDATTLAALDEQCDQVWVYLFGGWLDAYYRFAIVSSTVDQGMTIDELTTPAGSNLNEVTERARILSWGYTYAQLNSGGVPSLTLAADLVISLRKSELEAMTDNVRLDPYLIECPDDVIDVAGPWRQRMFLLTSKGYVYPSLQNSPSAFNSLQLIDLTQYGDPRWIQKAGSGVYVGMEKDVILLDGSGDNSPDLARIDLYGRPLNVASPPIDAMQWTEGNSIIYRSTDGPMELTGTSVRPLPVDGISLLWRGQTRHSVGPLNVGSGRFRCAIDNYHLYMIVAEEDNATSNILYRYSYPLQEWDRFIFSEAGNLLSIFNEPDGTLIAGDDAGNVWVLESGTQDNGVDITVDLLTPIMDGGQPLAAKDPFDVQIHAHTGGDTLALALYKDGDGSPTTEIDTLSTSAPQPWTYSLSSLGAFRKLQLGISGETSTFDLSSFNISYRLRPQRMIFFDTGYYLAPEPGDILEVQEVELDGIVLSSTFTIKVYTGDTLAYTSPAQTATTSKRTTYRIPVSRGVKGDSIRVEFIPSDSGGTGDIGIDPYRVRIRFSGSGNQDSSRGYRVVWPSGEAS